MDTSQPTSSQGEGSNLIERAGTEPEGDVIFLPCDSEGSEGELNTRILEKLGLPNSLIPSEGRLSNGYSFVRAKDKLLCFVVTVGGGNTANLLRKHLALALLDQRIIDAKSLWIPLMGTGFERLSNGESKKIILQQLAKTGWRDRPGTRIIIAPPPSSRPPRVPPPKKPSDRLPLSDASKGAFDFAAALRSGRTQRGGPISTTLLFFALAQSQEGVVPRSLAGDRAASLFSAAVHALAQEHFREAWVSYFQPDFVLPASPITTTDIGNTPNVNRVLQAADRARKGDSIEISDLIVALLNYQDGRHRQSIEAMGLTMKQLLDEYNKALAREIAIGKIKELLHNDVASDIDQLGYDRYAMAITKFLTNSNTTAPLSISIQAPWGAGKSSLMHQIRNGLDPKVDRERHKNTLRTMPAATLRDVLSLLDRETTPDPRLSRRTQRYTVWFNAWKYDTSEQLWAGLVDAIVSQISERLEPVDRELFLLRLQLARIDDGIVRRKIYDRIATLWWNKTRAWLTAGLALVPALFGIHHAASNLLPRDVLVFLAWSPAGAIFALILYLADQYRKAHEKTQNEPAKFSLSEFLSVPNYDQTLGSIHHIHKDLIRVLSLVPPDPKDNKPYPIVVFIDDLDRCSPSKVASVVEGVCMFLASEDYRCVFVIGMDPQMIAAALEEAHAKVRQQLPRSERSVPLGWRFMDKFIQLPFTIPPNNRDVLESYVGLLTSKEKTNPDEHQDVHDLDAPTSGAPAAGPVNGLTAIGRSLGAWLTSRTRSLLTLRKAQARATSSPDSAPETKKHETETPRPDGDPKAPDDESRDVAAIIGEVAFVNSGGLSNPREIKRLANLSRLYLSFREARHEKDQAWQSPSVGQYARWIMITLRWPDMMRWLQWGADETTWAKADLADGLVSRRLKALEDQAKTAKNIKAWRAAINTKLNMAVPEGSWASDQKLLDFFKTEAKLLPQDRLSQVIVRGFW